MLYIVAAFAIGVWYQVELWRPVFGPHPYWLVLRTHLASVGGVIQMIMGMGLWMFPLTAPVERCLTTSARGWPGSPGRCSTAGRWPASGVEFWLRRTGSDVAGALTVLTGLMQLAALLIFIWHLWSLRLSRRSAERRQGAGAQGAS